MPIDVPVKAETMMQDFPTGHSLITVFDKRGRARELVVRLKVGSVGPMKLWARWIRNYHKDKK